ncbi:hypothetical protein ACLKA7_009328 [Drosophila subpalustris]
MAFSAEVQAIRPNSETNNNVHQDQPTKINNSSIKRNNADYTNGASENNNYTESRKSQRYNIDDPGASTGSGNNIRGSGERQRDNRWRESLLAQLQLLADENRANSAYEGFATVDNDFNVNNNNNNNTNRYKYASQSENNFDQGAHAQQEQQQQQQEQQGRANSASYSSNKNTLFTRVGTHHNCSEACFAYGELFSKLYNFGDSIPYRDASLVSDWDNIPYREVLQQLILSRKPSRERPDYRSTDFVGDKGVDMESHQGMSGAMPTATVEEIDVPVFIDEYLQNIEASSSTSSSNKSEENGKEICSETDIFDFDFDINLIAEDLIERKEMDQCNQIMDITYSDNINSNDLIMDELQLSQLWDDEGEEAFDVGTMCKGIDINTPMDPDLSNILVSEQNPMLSNFSQGSLLSSSQTKYINELPMLGDENSMEANYYGSSQASLGFGSSLLDMPSDGVALICQDVSSTSSCVGVKRTASMAGLVPIAESMPQKRNNLVLTINKSLIHHPDNINTPEIIEQVLNLDYQNSATNISTQDRIYEDLRSTEENTAFTVFQDFSAPNTPYSAYSVSTSTSASNAPTCHTGFGGLITAPGSPAFSTASTSQFSASTTSNGGSKRKRGRPAKEHADGPDPELMSQMTGEELKLYQDRIKNNEASRVSRRKTKKREDAEKLEEECLLAKFKELSAILQRVLKDKKLLEDHLMTQHHRNSTYVKPEPEH